MRRLLVLASALCFVSACSGHGITPGGPAQGRATDASVTVIIRLPKAITSSKSRRRFYVSGNTAKATIAVTQGTNTVATTTLACTTTECTGTVDAPIGTDNFTATLYDASNNVLAVGNNDAFNIVAGDNQVPLTFDPVVAQIIVAIDPSQSAPYLATGGPASVKLDVTFKDPSGYTITGPAMFLSPSNTSCIPTQGSPCLTVSLTNSDTSGATTLSAASFTSAAAASTVNLLLSGRPVPPFDDPQIAVSATGAQTLQGTDVPVSPAVTTAQFPQRATGLIQTGGPGMTSVFDKYSYETNTINSGTEEWSPGPIINDLSIANPPGILDPSNPTLACCIGGNALLADDNGGHLLGGMPAAPTIVGNSTDPVLWFYDSTAAAFTLADLSTSNNTAYNDIVPIQQAGPVTAAILDSSEPYPTYYIWYAFDGGSSSAPSVSAFSTSNAPTSAAPQLSLAPNGGVIAGLVNGPAGSDSVFAIISANSNTYIDKVPLATVLTGGTFSGGVTVSPATNLFPGSAGLGLPIVGYSPADGMIYASDWNGALYRINPTSGAATTVTVKGTAAASQDPNRLPMALLPDNSLAYVGSYVAGANDNNTYDLIHITPGSSPSARSFVPACATAPCAYYLWSIQSSGSPPNYNATIYTTDGGKTTLSVW